MSDATPLGIDAAAAMVASGHFIRHLRAASS
jgi:hypothetical protein